MAQTLYKWLDEGRITPYQKRSWPVRKGAWTPVVADPVLCERGWHGIELGNIIVHLQNDTQTLWIVETRGKVIGLGGEKFAAEQMRLVDKVGTCTPELLRLTACDIAESCLAAFESFVPGDDRPRKAIEVARRFGAGMATDEERSAAESAARSAAWSAADQMLLARLESSGGAK